MTTKAQWAADLYAQLKPQADTARSRFILERTPADIQAEMQALVGASAGVTQGQAVMVTDAAGVPVPGTPGVAQVSGGAVTAIKLTV